MGFKITDIESCKMYDKNTNESMFEIKKSNSLKKEKIDTDHYINVSEFIEAIKNFGELVAIYEKDKKNITQKILDYLKVGR